MGHEYDGAVSEAYRLREFLRDIQALAASCLGDMQGRLQDDEHRRAFAVLGSIASRCNDALEI